MSHEQAAREREQPLVAFLLTCDHCGSQCQSAPRPVPDAAYEPDIACPACWYLRSEARRLRVYGRC